jgi:hypothetical protein
VLLLPLLLDAHTPTTSATASASPLVLLALTPILRPEFARAALPTASVASPTPSATPATLDTVFPTESASLLLSHAPPVSSNTTEFATPPALKAPALKETSVKGPALLEPGHTTRDATKTAPPITPLLMPVLTPAPLEHLLSTMSAKSYLKAALQDNTGTEHHLPASPASIPAPNAPSEPLTVLHALQDSLSARTFVCLLAIPAEATVIRVSADNARLALPSAQLVSQLPSALHALLDTTSTETIVCWLWPS